MSVTKDNTENSSGLREINLKEITKCESSLDPGSWTYPPPTHTHKKKSHKIVKLKYGLHIR